MLQSDLTCMPRCGIKRRDNERGMSLIQAVVAVALTGLVLALAGTWVNRSTQLDRARHVGRDLGALALATSRFLEGRRAEVGQAWDAAIRSGRQATISGSRRSLHLPLVSLTPAGLCAMTLAAHSMVDQQRLVGVRAAPGRGKYVIRVVPETCGDHAGGALNILVYWDRPLTPPNRRRTDTTAIAAALQAGGVGLGVSPPENRHYVVFGTEDPVQIGNPVIGEPAGVLAARAYVGRTRDRRLMRLDGTTPMRGSLSMADKPIKGIGTLHADALSMGAQGLESTGDIEVGDVSGKVKVVIKGADVQSGGLDVRNQLTTRTLQAQRIRVNRIDGPAEVTFGKSSRSRETALTVHGNLRHTGRVTVTHKVVSLSRIRATHAGAAVGGVDISGQSLVSDKGVLSLTAGLSGPRARAASCKTLDVSTDFVAGEVRVCLPNARPARTFLFR